MRKTIKLLVLIIAISFVIDKIVYYSLNTISDKVMSGQAIGKLNQYLQKKDSLDLIVFGTSRANHHIDVSLLSDSSFNMGMDGTAIAYSSTLIKLLPKNKKQFLIWHIDPNKVFDENYTSKDIIGLKTKFHRNEIIKNEIKKANQANPLQSFYWSIDYNGKAFGILKNLFSPNYSHSKYDGYDPIKVSETQKEIFKSTLKLKNADGCIENYIINPSVKSHLKEVQQFCKENNKTLIIVTSPTYKPKCTKQYQKLDKILEEMSIVYYDYSSFFVNNNSFEYWKDYTHLSGKGATIFSNKLKEILLEVKLLKDEK